MEGTVTMVNGPTRSTVTGSFVVRGVLLALLATAVLPPAGAWWLHSRRVADTTERVQRAATQTVTADDGRVLCSAGRLPRADASGAGVAHVDWLAIAIVDAGNRSDSGPDAWGQCLLMGRGWVLSAGANGIIETPLDAAAPRGDDIGVRVR